MKMILTERVKSVGDVGELVNVSAGFARNYLIPNKFAIIADDTNKKAMENQKKRLAIKVLAAKNAALELKAKIDTVKLELTKKVGANGKLFGTVTNTELALELEKLGYDVERRQIIIENPIKQPGDFEVKVKLFTEVEALFQVVVLVDQKQLEEIKKGLAAAKKSKAQARIQAEEQSLGASMEGETSPEVNTEAVEEDVEEEKKQDKKSKSKK